MRGHREPPGPWIMFSQGPLAACSTPQDEPSSKHRGTLQLFPALPQGILALLITCGLHLANGTGY